jgi:hypothetical protein
MKISCETVAAHFRQSLQKINANSGMQQKNSHSPSVHVLTIQCWSGAVSRHGDTTIELSLLLLIWEITLCSSTRHVPISLKIMRARHVS